MNKPPAFQFYPKDWLSLRGLTYEQKGVYIDLLAMAWEDEGLPSDPERIRSLLSLTPSKFAAVWHAIEAKFESDGNGRITNARLERQRKELVAFRRNASRAANKRWEKERNATA